MGLSSAFALSLELVRDGWVGGWMDGGTEIGGELGEGLWRWMNRGEWVDGIEEFLLFFNLVFCECVILIEDSSCNTLLMRLVGWVLRLFCLLVWLTGEREL